MKEVTLEIAEKILEAAEMAGLAGYPCSIAAVDGSERLSPFGWTGPLP